MLFADYLDQWLEVVRARIKPATFGSYQGMVKSTIGPYFRKKELTLKELEARHIQQFYTEKLKTVTPNSVIHYHAVIYQALKYAMKTDMVPQNVAMKVDRPRKNSFQPTFLDAEQMQKLFEVVKGTRLELPVLVAAFYGLRRGEVLGLKWDAIDFNRGTLTIKRTVTEATIDGTMKIIEQDSAKTKSSLRTLPLVGSFRDYFQKVKEAQELNKKVCGNCYNYEYDGYVFVNELGERMRPNYLTEYFPKYIAKHGMPKMRFHDLRHSCASLLLANGVPLNARVVRAVKANPGMARPLGFQHDRQYLCPSRLQIQNILGAGDGDRACATGGRRLRKSLEGGLSRKSGEKNKSRL